MRQKPVVLVSACLLGIRCRYDQKDALCRDLLAYSSEIHPVPVCPEQLGGLPTPREPADLKGGDGADVLGGRAKLVTRSGKDVTKQFIRGAEETYRIAEITGARIALMKDKSPSCGLATPHCDLPQRGAIGVTASILVSKGIRVIELGVEDKFPTQEFLAIVNP